MEVPPTPDSIYELGTDTHIDDSKIDVDKIKSLALQFDIDTPEWAKDTALLEKRIK